MIIILKTEIVPFCTFIVTIIYNCSTEPRPNGSILTPTLVILSAVVVLLGIAGVIGAVFLRRQCQRQNDPGGGDGGGSTVLRSADGTAGQQQQPPNGASTISKTGLGNGGTMLMGGNPRSQSLKPLLMGSVDGEMDGQQHMFTTRMEPDPRWTNGSKHFSQPPISLSSQLSWPVGEPPPSTTLASLPPPSGLIMEAGLITPPYTTDSSLELRSPDIIPPPVIGI